jgi:serine/threonine protein kinase
MSPEQVRNTKDVDYRSDIYSLGVVLWEMVTGRVPYDINTESTFDVFEKIVHQQLANTATKWDAVIEKATQKEVGKRKLDLELIGRKPAFIKNNIIYEITKESSYWDLFQGNVKEYFLNFNNGQIQDSIIFVPKKNKYGYFTGNMWKYFETIDLCISEFYEFKKKNLKKEVQ